MKVFLYSFVFVVFMTSCGTRKGTLSSASKPTSSVQTNKPKNSSVKSTSVSGISYINRYKDIAVREMNQYGIPASIKLAQALLESGNGNSYLAKEANNHFGIKCGGVWNGPSVARDDDHPNDCFRVYGNPEESFKDHSQFLLRKRYEKLFTLSKNDYKGWARGLKDAGYATNPRYPELLIDLIERYELYRFDTGESYIEKEKREDKVHAIVEVKTEVEPKVQTEQIKAPVKMTIYEVKASDTLYAISRQYNVTIDQLKQFNGLTSDNLTIGQLLVVQK